jgi:hypothetical protein
MKRDERPHGLTDRQWAWARGYLFILYGWEEAKAAAPLRHSDESGRCAAFSEGIVSVEIGMRSLLEEGDA